MPFTPRYPEAEQSGQIGQCIQCSALITGVPIHDGFGTCSAHRRRMIARYLASEPCAYGSKSKAMMSHRESTMRGLEGDIRTCYAEEKSGLPYPDAVREWPSYQSLGISRIIGYVLP